MVGGPRLRLNMLRNVEEGGNDLPRTAAAAASYVCNVCRDLLVVFPTSIECVRSEEGGARKAASE